MQFKSLMLLILTSVLSIGCASVQPQSSAERQALEGVDAAESESPIQDTPLAADNSGPDSMAALTVPLKFRPRSGIDILDATSEVERAYFLATGVPLAVVLEIRANYSTAGKYGLASQYTSLAAFASAMQSQVSAYRWQVVADSTLVVKPAAGAELDKTVTNFSFSDQTACYILAQLGVRLNPSQGDTGGCAIRSTPEYISSHSAYDIMQQKISIVYSGTRTAQATILDILARLDSPVGVAVYRWDSRMNLIWEVRW